MIELKHLGKIYSSASGSVEALKDVNLTIADGEIFGIIGLSGAGKSTLVRCINLLERPTSGEVLVDGQNIMTLSQKELLQVRRQIGMIFQGFNLLEQRTVLRKSPGDQSPVPALRRGDQRARPQHDALDPGAAARDQQDARRHHHRHHARDEGHRPDL